jgi:hypothetical protein
MVDYSGDTYLQVSMPMLQYAIISDIFTLNGFSLFERLISFDDDFCLVRAYINKNNRWVEIGITHSDKIYDPNIVTLLVKVLGNELQVTLPSIYELQALTGTMIRVDIFTTKGVLNKDLASVPYGNFTAEWNDYDTLNPNPGAIKLNNVPNILIYSTDSILGGKNASTLDEIRHRAIYHTNSSKVIIPFDNLKVDLLARGYEVIKLIDNVTDKVYLASKELPNRILDGLSFSPLTTNLMISFFPNASTFSTGYGLSITSKGLGRYTVTNKAILKSSNGNISLLTDLEITALNDLANINSADLQTALNVKGTTHLIHPFFTVLDTLTGVTTGRVYHLTDAKIIGKSILDTNVAKGYNIITTVSTFALIDGNYVLLLTANKPTGLGGIGCQLCYTDVVDGVKYYLFGAVYSTTDTTITFRFILSSNFDIDESHNINIVGVTNEMGLATTFNFPLTGTFNILYTVSTTNAGTGTSFDNLLYRENDPDLVGATHETITLEFGKYMDGLYCPANDIILSGEYQKYTEVVYATYLEKIYEMDAYGKKYTIDVNGNITFNVLFDVGDPILDEYGDQVILHNIGDYVLDLDGKTIPVSGFENSIGYSIGLTGYDLRYFYAEDTTLKEYVANIPRTIHSYLTKEISMIANSLHERTSLLYKPTGEPESVLVTLNNNTKVSMGSTLYPSVTFYLIESNFNNPSLVSKLKTLTRTIIGNHIKKSEITLAGLISDINEAIKDRKGITFEVVSFLPNKNVMVTVLEGAFNIGENLIKMPDGRFTVTDAVIVSFKKITN